MMTGCGALPVVDEVGRLVDMYARADVMLLAANNTYRRVALADITVAQALAVGRARGAYGGGGGGAGGGGVGGASATATASPRAHTCVRADTLRSVVEALSLPGVRRLVVVDGATRRVEGVVSLSDVVAFLLS
jgi:CBS domain-containing protein